MSEPEELLSCPVGYDVATGRVAVGHRSTRGKGRLSNPRAWSRMQCRSQTSYGEHEGTGGGEDGTEAHERREQRWLGWRAVSTVEYRCPTHGKIADVDPAQASPTCPMLIRRDVDGAVSAEACGLPLNAYFE